MKSLIVIPCRYQSTRLPKKHTIVLANGKTMPQMVFDICEQSQADEVIVATDHDEIYQSLKQRGCRVVMTSDTHKSGTDRVAEVAAHFTDYDIILNVQGDEPLLAPATINALLQAKMHNGHIPLYSAMVSFTNEAEVRNPNNVKVVVDTNKQALYFSRAPIGATDSRWHCYKHLGLYAFEREYLLRFPTLGITPLAAVESLEQLRVLERGDAIGMIELAEEALGIDTPEDLALLEMHLQSINNE